MNELKLYLYILFAPKRVMFSTYEEEYRPCALHIADRHCD